MSGNNQNYDLVKTCFKCKHPLRVKLNAVINMPSSFLNELNKSKLLDPDVILEIEWKNQILFCEKCNWQKIISIQKNESK